MQNQCERMKCPRIVPINKCHVCGKQWNKNLDLG